MDNVITINIPENFAVNEVANFRNQVNKFIEEGHNKFMFDFSYCTFIDSTGLGVLVTVYKKCREHNGNVKLVGLNEDVMKLFKLTRLDRVFEID
ncbi:MAG: STAS domain-containing protein [Solirubrobacterales bacterium]